MHAGCTYAESRSQAAGPGIGQASDERGVADLIRRSAPGKSVNARGESPRENFLCHTFFGDQKVDQRQDREMKGIYSDAFTPELRLPDGFGLYYTPDDDLQWMPMFNNRGEQSVRVAMRVELTLVRAKDLKKSLRPLYSTLRSGQGPHLFFVDPARGERQFTF